MSGDFSDDDDTGWDNEATLDFDFGEPFSPDPFQQPPGVNNFGGTQLERNWWRVWSDPGLHIILRRSPQTRKGVLKKPLRMPIAPLDDFGWDVSYGWTDYDTINKGQFSRRGGRQQRVLSISTLAMDWSAPWATVQQGHAENWRNDQDAYGTATAPWRLAHRLDWLIGQGTPMMLIVKNPALYSSPDVQMDVTLRSMTVRERAGEPDSRYFQLDFVEYRAPKVQRKQYGDRHELPALVEINQIGVAHEVRRGDKKLRGKQRHQIGSGNRPATLRSLAKHFYGSPKKWREIKQRNAGRSTSIQKLSGDDPLSDLFDHRKRKKQPVRLVIPDLNDDRGNGNGHGGFDPSTLYGKP